MRIDQALTPAIQSASQAARGKGDTEDFGRMLMDVLKEINQTQLQAREMQNSFLTGQRNVEYHDVMIAMEKAGVALQLTLQVRNKLLEAYQEISRMQL